MKLLKRAKRAIAKVMKRERKIAASYSAYRWPKGEPGSGKRKMRAHDGTMYGPFRSRQGG